MSTNRVVSQQTEALFQASENGDAKAVADLVRDPDADINWHCTQSVRLTAFRGEPEILEDVLKKIREKLDDEAVAELVNLRNQPNLKVTQLLVEAGSNVNPLDEQGYSPLIVAAKKNQTDVIDFLRKHGADATLKTPFGEDALHFAELRNNMDAIHLLE
ncbi:hypothetical protein BBJ28_00007973 [Nothophytophthora sp. Chile5]|nr:hypothetical protein BBJ28_00007973 [Nothophytophthora sp. Chile5]